MFSETGGAIGDDGDGGDPGGEDPDPLGELLPGYTDGGCRGYGCGVGGVGRGCNTSPN